MKAVILDMYGVILKDPEGGLMPFVQQTFPRITTEEVYRSWALGNIGAIASLDFFARLGYCGDLAAIERDYLETIAIDPDFTASVSWLKDHYRLGLISNDLREWSAYLRLKYGLDELFETIVISGEVGQKKPEERLFTIALETLGLDAAECVYVDDRRKNLDAAAALGFTPILFNSRKVPYAGIVVDDYAGLIQALQGLEG